MSAYLAANYCPTLDDAPDCEASITVFYPHMLVCSVTSTYPCISTVLRVLWSSTTL